MMRMLVCFLVLPISLFSQTHQVTLTHAYGYSFYHYKGKEYTVGTYGAIPFNVKLDYEYHPENVGLLVGVDYHDNVLFPTRHIYYDAVDGSQRVRESIRDMLVGGYIGFTAGGYYDQRNIFFLSVGGGGCIKSKRELILPSSKQTIDSYEYNNPMYFVSGDIGIRPQWTVDDSPVVLGFIMNYNFKYIFNKTYTDKTINFERESYQTFVHSCFLGIKIGVEFD